MTGRSPSVLVIGAGSIGRRHAENLLVAGASVTVADEDPSRAAMIAGADAVVFSDELALEAFDGVVVATPTVYHADHAKRGLEAGCHVLVEKPFATSLEELDDLQSSERVMVGYNLRLHEPVRRAVEAVHRGEVGEPLLVRLWFGWYLPYWRPGRDYRQVYSARASEGGGILLDASHELDLAIWLLDTELEVVASFIDRVGALEIDVEDTVMAILRQNGGAVVEINLDYLSRRYRRGFEVIGEEATIRLDWARRTLEIEDDIGVRVQNVSVDVTDSYAEEARRFLRFVSGHEPPPVDAATGAASVALADQIRERAT